MAGVSVYMTDFCSVVLPYDFPASAVRKNGKPDMRRKIGPALSHYFDCLNEAVRQGYEAGKPMSELQAVHLSWEEWLTKS
jgi:hypothetical protein